MAYVYRHIRLDKNEPFYIGVACNKKNNYLRAYEKSTRSEWWKKIVAKTEYKVEIIFDDLTKEEAKQKEIEFIKLYGRSDLNLGTLVNMTDGGDGLINRVFTLEYRAKLSNAAKNRVMSEAQKEKLRQLRLGTTISQEHKDKISKTMKAYIATDSLRAFRSKRMTDNNPAKGKFGAAALNFKGYIVAYKKGILFGVYEGVYDASRNLLIMPTNINRVVTGKRKTSNGFTFKRMQEKPLT
jgi:hypothetical protein